MRNPGRRGVGGDGTPPFRLKGPSPCDQSTVEWEKPKPGHKRYTDGALEDSTHSRRDGRHASAPTPITWPRRTPRTGCRTWQEQGSPQRAGHHGKGTEMPHRVWPQERMVTRGAEHRDGFGTQKPGQRKGNCKEGTYMDSCVTMLDLNKNCTVATW